MVDRALACTGKLIEAQPEFEFADAVPGAGVLLALPALEAQGLLDVGQDVYGAPRNGLFGLRSTLPTFACVAPLRPTAPEQLTAGAPGGLGSTPANSAAPCPSSSTWSGTSRTAALRAPRAIPARRAPG